MFRKLKMSRYLLKILLIFSPLILINIVNAACPQPTTCDTVGEKCCISKGVNPAVGFEPPTDTLLKNNCTSLTSLRQYQVPHQYGDFQETELIGITHKYDDLYNYCAIGTSFSATSDGELVIFSEGVFLSVYVNDNLIAQYTNLHPFEKHTNTQVKIGDKIIIKLGENNTNLGPGWRAYSKLDDEGEEILNFPWDRGNLIDLVNKARSISSSNGYTIISEQLWGDGSNSYTYDTYDFEDLVLIVATGDKPPSCNDHAINLFIEPSNSGKLYLSENAKFTVLPSNPSLYRYYGNITNLFSISNCAPTVPQYLNGSSVTCTINYKGDTNRPTSAEWVHQYKLCDGSLCSDVCTSSKSFYLWPYPGILRTRFGDTYIGDSSASGKRIYQSRYYFTGTPQGYYQTSSELKYGNQTFGTKSSSVSGYNPSSVSILTEKGNRSFLKEYFDANSFPNYYDKFAPKLKQDGRLNRITYSTDITFNQNDFESLKSKQDSDSKVQLVDVNGSLTLGNGSGNITCRSKTIFIISNNLIINPDLRVAGNNSACLFIVKGTTIINKSHNEDEVNAFILTDGFRTIDSKGTLHLTGGVISKSNILDKNINKEITNANNIIRNTATELLDFEGARYIRHFKNYLPNPFYISIKEIQYIK